MGEGEVTVYKKKNTAVFSVSSDESYQFIIVTSFLYTSITVVNFEIFLGLNWFLFQY